MCEQCLTKAESYGEILPGISLVKANKDGSFMKAGDWGLVVCNDPFLYWSASATPTTNPEYTLEEDADIDDMSDERFDAWISWRTKVDKFYQSQLTANGSAFTSYKLLFDACAKTSLKQDKDIPSVLAEELYHYFAKVIENNS